MPGRSGLRWFAGLLLLAGVVLGHRACADRRADAHALAQVASPAPLPAPVTGPPGSADADDEARGRHAAALRSAVSTLHGYIASLPEDRAKADAVWIDGTPSPEAREADLRSLPAPPRALRVQNRAPRPLDAVAMPSEVAIEVELRLHLDAAPPRRYAGTYRLRRVGEAGDEWRITGAAIDALPPPR